MTVDFTVYVPIVAAILYAAYKWITLNDQYFVKRNLPYLKPTFLVGNTLGLFLKKCSLDGFMSSIYNKFPNAKMIGFFDMRDPIYFVRDIEVIEKITKKDFNYFEDRSIFFDERLRLFPENMVLLKGKKWREMRATLSPAFTGSKMKQMFKLVLDSADEMAKFFVKESKSNKTIRWEMRELFSFYANDVIASCAFGLNINSLEDRTNEFFTVGNSLTLGSTKAAIRSLILRTYPNLMRALGIEFYPAYVKKFFRSMVFDTIKVREEKSIIRPDMINLLMQARNESLKSQNNKDGGHNSDATFSAVTDSDWTDDKIVAQCFLFFAAGFDTASVTLSFLAYELAVNQNVQQKLYNEVSSASASLNGERLTYDTLQKMKYMDQVVSETLRKWPSTVFTTRMCTKDYVCELDSHEKFVIEKGKNLWIPIAAIHRDPQYYADPEKFDPERFSDENKNQMKSGTFLAFGNGPRSCIGARFGAMEIKAIIFNLLLSFTIQPYEKTQIPVKIAKFFANWATEKGIHLELKPRE